MSTDYEPGTVAIATVRGAKGLRVVAVADAGVTPWVSIVPVDGCRWHADKDVTDVRPLVVLDLGPAIVTALRDTLPERRADWDGRDRAVALLAEQIEAQTKPPRIPEPGLWGVVEAGQLGTNEGARSEWTRFRHGWADEITGPIRWDQLVNPRLVREGVES